MAILRSDEVPFGEVEGLPLQRLSDAGGLTQFGCHRLRLPPGACSSERHWHEREDEMVIVLRGAPVLVDDDGEHALAPGDAVTFRGGVANGHHLVNRTRDDCELLVIGTRVRDDVCHYVDSGRRLVTAGRRWELLEADGAVRASGELDQAFPCTCQADGREPASGIE